MPFRFFFVALVLLLFGCGPGSLSQTPSTLTTPSGVTANPALDVRQPIPATSEPTALLDDARRATGSRAVGKRREELIEPRLERWRDGRLTRRVVRNDNERRS